VLIRKVSVYLYATFHTQDRYLQANPTAQSSTFHFFRASKNKKSLPLSNAETEQKSELNWNLKKCP